MPQTAFCCQGEYPRGKWPGIAGRLGLTEARRLAEGAPWGSCSPLTPSLSPSGGEGSKNGSLSLGEGEGFVVSSAERGG